MPCEAAEDQVKYVCVCVVMVLIKLVISITPGLTPYAGVDLNVYNTKHIGFMLHCMCEGIDN